MPLGTASSEPRNPGDSREREPDSSLGDRDGADDYVYEEYDDYEEDYDDYYTRGDEFGMFEIVLMSQIISIIHIFRYSYKKN